MSRLHGLPIEHEAVQYVKEEIKASLEEEAETGKISFWILFWDNTELQFGRRLRTSFLINWVSATLEEHLSSRVLTIQSGTTILGHQHAGVFLYYNLLEPQLLAVTVRNSSRRAQHCLRHCFISSNLVHRKSWTASYDDLVSDLIQTAQYDVVR